MTLNRRDTIILAVLVNAVFLSLLFLLASRSDPQEPVRPQTPLAQEEQPQEEEVVAFAYNEQEPQTPDANPFVASTPITQQESLFSPSTAQEPVSHSTEVGPDTSPTFSSAPQWQEDEYREVIVKRGDFLEKIARANHVSVSELKRINKLADDRIDIGQILYVPKKTAVRSEPQPVREDPRAEYYVVKSGDSPWTIARKNRVKLDELLQLNGLDEETARNLRPGDKIRVR